jgi:hypothetical protein
MQVSKSLLAVCAATVCAGFISSHAQDTPAQAAARAALMQSMGQPAIAAPTAPKTPPPAPASKPNPPVAPATPVAPVTASPAATTPAPAPVAMTPQPLNPDAQAAARAALLQSMGQTDIPAAATSAPTVVAPVVVAPTPTKPAPTIPAAPEMKPVATNPAKASNAIIPGREPGFPPMVAPALPISSGKEQQLDALLAQYKANLISPEEYQKQRATILAAP